MVVLRGAAIPRRVDSDVPGLGFTLLPRPRATASRPSGSPSARFPSLRSAHFPSLSATVLESVRVGSGKRTESDDRGKTPKRVSRRFARLRTTTISLRAPRRFAIAPPPPILRLRRPRWRPRHGRDDVIRSTTQKTNRTRNTGCGLFFLSVSRLTSPAHVQVPRRRDPRSRKMGEVGRIAVFYRGRARCPHRAAILIQRNSRLNVIMSPSSTAFTTAFQGHPNSEPLFRLRSSNRSTDPPHAPEVGPPSSRSFDPSTAAKNCFRTFHPFLQPL